MDLMRLDRATVPSPNGNDFRGVCLGVDADGNVGLRAETPLEWLGQFRTADRLSQITMHSKMSAMGRKQTEALLALPDAHRNPGQRL